MIFSKHIFFLFASSVITIGVFGFSAEPALASCVCESSDGSLHELPDSDDYTTEEDCNNQCITEPDANNPEENYQSGTVADSDTLAELAEQQSEEAEENVAAFESQGVGYCYCGDTTNGAQREEGIHTRESCEAICDSQGKAFVSHGATTAVFPVSNALCFRQEECIDVGGVWSDAQPVECEMNAHYCYPVSEPITLSINLGGITTVLDIGTYISAIFNYGLGIAAIIAVIMIMIGGMQYIIGSRGGGGSEEVSKGKERIKNAIIGLVLILASYTLLATVNPALVRFKVLRLPLIKPALFITGSCEEFAEQGYQISPTVGECGAQGTIVADPNGSSISSTCSYATCGEGTACAKVGDEYTCLTCETSGRSSGFQAGEANCSALTPTEEGNKKNQCVYSDNNSQCNLVEIQCAGVTSCIQYPYLQFYSADTGRIYIYRDPDVVGKICNQNPCSETVTDGPCAFNQANAEAEMADGRGVESGRPSCTGTGTRTTTTSQ